MKKKLGEKLVEAGLLNESGLRLALAHQERFAGRLGRILIDMHLVEEADLLPVLAQHLRVPVVDLDHLAIGEETLSLVSAEYAEEHSLIPFRVEGSFADVAMAEPTVAIIDDLQARSRKNVRPHLAGPRMIERAVARFYGRGLLSVPDGTAPRSAGAAPSQRPRGGAAVANELEFDLDRPDATGDLRRELDELRALLTRDEDVLRKLLTMLIEKGIFTREELAERLRQG